MDTIVDGSWVQNNALKYEKRFAREYNRFDASFLTKRNHALESRLADYLIQELRESPEYTWDSMLIIKNPFSLTPLCAYAIFTTDSKYYCRYVVKGKEPQTDYKAQIEITRHHCVPIMGLYADCDNEIRIELTNQAGDIVKRKKLVIKTEPLVEELIDAVYTQKKEPESADDFLLIAGGKNMYTCAIDSQADIRYYISAMANEYGISPLRNGHLLFLERDIATPSYTKPQGVMMYDMDYMGRVHKTYYIKNGLHHTVSEMENGNILLGSSSMKEYSEDSVVEIDRNTGEIVNTIELTDYFDEKYKDSKDWAHINSVYHEEQENTILVSMCNLHSIAKFDWNTDKELLWILADPRVYAGSMLLHKVLRPLGTVKWPYQQNAAVELHMDGEEAYIKHYVVFDNHCHEQRPLAHFDDDPRSFVNFYRVNEQDMTVEMEEQLPCFKSINYSNAVYEPESERVLVMEGKLEPMIDDNLGCILECDYKSHRILREYFVRNGFATAYRFTPDINRLNRKMSLQGNYVVGDTIGFDEEDDLPAEKELIVNKEKHSLMLSEDYLFVKGADGEILKVYLKAKDKCYAATLPPRVLETEDIEGIEYYSVMCLKDVKAGSYDIYLETEEQMIKTNQVIVSSNPIGKLLTRTRHVINKFS